MRINKGKSAFITKDSQRFETKEEAMEHTKNIVIKEKIYELQMNEDLIAEKLIEVATRYPGYRMLLEKESDWTKWSVFQIKNIREELFDKNIKIKPEKK